MNKQRGVALITVLLVVVIATVLGVAMVREQNNASSSASKGDALKSACRHLGIDPHDVLAFGDSENDIEMFRVAGAAVAMGQADEQTKAAATYVTVRHDEAGVARAIEKLLTDRSLE